MNIVFFLILLPFFSLQAAQSISVDGHGLEVSIAQTEAERMQGLMHRKAPLKSNEGMLFIFPNVERQVFHMQETWLALDMLFFDEEGKLVHFYEQCPPHSKRLYPSHYPVKWVLEVPGGWIKERKLQLGARLYNLSFELRSLRI